MFLRSNRRFDSIPATPANLLLDRQYQADSVNPAYKSLTPKEKLTVIQLNAVSAVGKLAIVYNEKVSYRPVNAHGAVGQLATSRTRIINLLGTQNPTIVASGGVEELFLTYPTDLRPMRMDLQAENASIDEATKSAISLANHILDLTAERPTNDATLVNAAVYMHRAAVRTSINSGLNLEYAHDDEILASYISPV